MTKNNTSSSTETSAYSVDHELTEYRVSLNKWIETLENVSLIPSHKGVIDRFVRDCQTLLNDLSKTESPTTADLCDFSDRRNSLEVQFVRLVEELD